MVSFLSDTEGGRLFKALGGGREADRISRSLDPDGGLSVGTVLSLLSQGESSDNMLADYPDLEVDDIEACLEYARAVIAHDSIDGVQVRT